MFTTVQEAFNHYRNADMTAIESRAAEIKGTLDKDPDADITSLNIEIEGLNEAKQNKDEKEKDDDDMNQRSQFNPITGMNYQQNNVPTENIFESAEYRSAFYKTMLGQDLTDVESRTFNQAMEQQDAERRADDFNTTTNSAAVLPTQTLNEVIEKARKEGGLIAHVRNFNLPTNISVPIGTPADKAKWHTEGDKVDAEEVKTTAIKFSGYEILKVFSISAAAKKMSVQAFESYLINELANTVLEAIADALVNGDGNEKGTGLIKGIKWDDENTVDLTGEYTDFTKAMAKLKRGYAANAKFAMNNATLYNKVYGIVDENKRPIFIEDPKGESIGKILGREVVVDDHIEDDTIILGAFDYMGMNIPEGLMVEVSRESSFRSGLVDYRAMAIADCKPLVEEAFIKLSEADAA